MVQNMNRTKFLPSRKFKNPNREERQQIMGKCNMISAKTEHGSGSMGCELGDI
jgi:hypothetical protein